MAMPMETAMGLDSQICHFGNQLIYSSKILPTQWAWGLTKVGYIFFFAILCLFFRKFGNLDGLPYLGLDTRWSVLWIKTNLNSLLNWLFNKLWIFFKECNCGRLNNDSNKALQMKNVRFNRVGITWLIPSRSQSFSKSTNKLLLS